MTKIWNQITQAIPSLKSRGDIKFLADKLQEVKDLDSFAVSDGSKIVSKELLSKVDALEIKILSDYRKMDHLELVAVISSYKENKELLQMLTSAKYLSQKMQDELDKEIQGLQ